VDGDISDCATKRPLRDSFLLESHFASQDIG